MKTQVLTLTAALVLAMPALAQTKPYAEGQRPLLSNTRAFPDLTIIYRFTGLRDDGTPGGAGVGASLICTNWGTPATIRTVLRSWQNIQVGITTVNIGTGETFTGSSKTTAYFNDDFLLDVVDQSINQGSLLVYSTSPHVQCAAFNLDASATPPSFITSLPAQRLNPPAGVTE